MLRRSVACSPHNELGALPLPVGARVGVRGRVPLNTPLPPHPARKSAIADASHRRIYLQERRPKAAGLCLSPSGRGGASGVPSRLETGRYGVSHALRYLAQLEFLDLSGRGFRDLDEHHVARAFVAREVLFAPREELVGTGLGAGLELDEGARVGR